MAADCADALDRELASRILAGPTQSQPSSVKAEARSDSPSTAVVRYRWRHQTCHVRYGLLGRVSAGMASRRGLPPELQRRQRPGGPTLRYVIRSITCVGCEDTADVLLEFRSGMIATVHLNYIQRPPSHRLEVVGTSGTIVWDNETGCVLWFQADMGEWKVFTEPVSFERNAMFFSEMRRFRLYWR
jgi:GFO/IDH/MocA oxidoreductase family protein